VDYIEELSKLRRQIDDVEKIILIGMPGCGKSAIGEELARRLGWPWFDSDREIEKQEKMLISEIFSCYGEAYFRDIEAQCVARLLDSDTAVISLGGGAVLNFKGLREVQEEVQRETQREIQWKSRQGCVFVYIHRSVEDILGSVDLSGRPLLRDNPEYISELFARRHPIYEQISHLCVHNDGTVDEVVDKVLADKMLAGVWERIN
jgi:shikimate kinase